MVAMASGGQQVQPDGQLPALRWVHGGLGTLSLLDDGTGLFCTDVGDVTVVPTETICRLRLTDGARLHARVKQGRGGGADFVHVLAWHNLVATVEQVGDDEVVLRAQGGPQVLLPAPVAAEHELEPGMRLEVVAAPATGERQPWRVAAVKRWPRQFRAAALGLLF